MRKVKNALLILLAAVFLAAGGLLPMAAAQLQDKATADAVQYGDIEALQLKLEEEVLSMTYQQKMRLVMNGMGVEITDENTRIKEKSIMEATYTALIPFLELFLGGSFDNDYIEYYPAMVYDEGDPSRYACYWHVTMSLDMSIEDSISVILDDETGKVLAMELIDPEMYIEQAYLQKMQYALADMYFGELGITPIAEWPLTVESVDKYEATGNSLAATCYQFVDAVYGEVNIEIGVRTHGFYIYII